MEPTPTRVTLVAVCLYEAFAIVTGLAPTITALSYELPVPLRAAAALGVVAWGYVHFFRGRRG